MPSKTIETFQNARETLKTLKKDTLLFEYTDDNFTNLTTLINTQLDEYINNNLNTIETKLNNYDLFSDLPLGTTMMWNNDTLPLLPNNDTKWIWCDGQNGTPDLRFKYPVGNEMSNETGVTVFDTSNIDGIITKNHILEHNHNVTIDKDGEHSHTMDEYAYSWSARPYWDNLKWTNRDKKENSQIGLGLTWKKDSGVNINQGEHYHLLTEGTHTHTFTGKEEGEENPKPFYPRFAYVNFITKVAK